MTGDGDGPATMSRPEVDGRRDAGDDDEAPQNGLGEAATEVRARVAADDRPGRASAIVHRDTDHAPEMALAQGVRSLDLLAHGLVDRIVPELPDAAVGPEAFSLRLGSVLQHELATLLAVDPAARHEARLERFARLGRLPVSATT
ncbi:hypothetical protein [Knoellia aerolata]|uniref:hypothetical protein n=1 Tax=Knoellia aerolata TaxID=442954 RepID=UPI001B8033AA|nr:hypothetical protein [Knoellia aerolata]